MSLCLYFEQHVSLSCSQIHSYSQATAIRPIMLYEDGLDYENCHNFSTNPERFYEDILTPGSITSDEPCWKKMQLSVGLPTPPSTPEKNSQRIRSSKMLEPSIMSLTYNNNYHFTQVSQSPNNNLQVVPDAITGDDVQDIIPFLTDLGNRSMASPNFFSDASCIPGSVSIQQKPCPSPCKPIDSLTHSPSSYPADNINVCGFNENEQSYHSNTNIYNDGKEGIYTQFLYYDLRTFVTFNAPLIIEVRYSEFYILSRHMAYLIFQSCYSQTQLKFENMNPR